VVVCQVVVGGCVVATWDVVGEWWLAAVSF
jgi:hypothetical protein